MIIVLESTATEAQVDHVCDLISRTGITSCYWEEADGIVVGSVGTMTREQVEHLSERIELLPFVVTIAHSTVAWQLASRDWKADRTVVRISEDIAVGGDALVVIAGPCSVESRCGLLSIACDVKARGADMLRGGAFKPRTSPHSFQGLGIEGLAFLREARARTGLPIVTEVMDAGDLDAVADVADMLQIGSRNMQNYSLLKAVGRTRKPVLLKRGMCSTVSKLLQAAEYILAGGNPHVILCERGIRTFETATRNTLDLNAIPLLKRLTHLPVIVDPSHGTGIRDLVTPMSLAAIAAGGDGLIIEVHPTPATALSDGDQSLTPSQFSDLVHQASAVAAAVGRSLHSDVPGHNGFRLTPEENARGTRP